MMSNSVADSGRKRKRDHKIFHFNSFCDPGCPAISSESQSFRDRIREFLRGCADIEDYHVRAMPVWSTLLLIRSNGGLFAPLYVVEETVKDSDQPYCDHCRSCGWSHHFVSRRRYHVLIPAEDEWKNTLNEYVLDSQNNLLHGVVHCNGFGHLLCINGVEGGSKNLRGRNLMDLWDRICTHLRTRKITLEDASLKRSMDLRLLHGVAYGYPWFGNWGYRFCSGSFGVEEHHYRRAISFLTSMTLDDVITDFSETKANQDLCRIVNIYRYRSETQLSTLQELLRFMLTISRTPSFARILPAEVPPMVTPLKTHGARAYPLAKNRLKVKEKIPKSRNYTSFIDSLDSRWPRRRLMYAADVIVDVLKEKKESDPQHRGMTRQEVRDEARLHIGDTGLLDYVLKSMNNVTVGDYTVRRAINPTNRILEYTIEDIIDGGGNGVSTEPDLKVIIKPQISKCVATIVSSSMVYTSFNVYDDIIWLYKNVILGFPETETAGLAVRVILNSKHLVKEWPIKDEEDHLLRFMCKVLSDSMELNLDIDRKSGPGELVAVPLHTSIGQLKEVAGEALRDCYCFTERFQVTNIVGLEGLGDGEPIFGALESGSDIWVRGIGQDWKTELRHEGGPENWVVKCKCGAKDDDGERMVSCDVCEIWQHTRCIGIKDSEAVPAFYWCLKCCSSLASDRVQSSFEMMDSCIDEYLMPVEEDYGMYLMPVEEDYGMYLL